MKHLTAILLGLLLGLRASLAYGPAGHEIVGRIADELLAQEPEGKKIAELIDGVSLQKAAVMADEIKSWDRKGVDEDPHSFPSYPKTPDINVQLRNFWRVNQPTHDVNSPNPSHHWFHYTDVPVLKPNVKYADGKAGRSKWDVVHMIPFCVSVLRGETPEDNDRKITKKVAVILLAHFVGDIHQPLHVGAEYFSPVGKVVDPETDTTALGDEGGNTFTIELNDQPPRTRGIKKKKFHGFWDGDTVGEFVPYPPKELPTPAARQQLDDQIRKVAHEMAMTEPKNWRPAKNVDLKDYAEAWANEMLPIAYEAHQRLEFRNVQPLVQEDRTVAQGEVWEKPMPDKVLYRKWASDIVRVELQKAGWRLAYLLQQSLRSPKKSQPTSSVSTSASPTSSSTPSPSATPTASASPSATPSASSTPPADEDSE
jgi:hypothetical protein